MTFKANKNNMKTVSDDVQIIEEFEASKTTTEPLTGHEIPETLLSYIISRNLQASSEQDHSEVLL